MVRIILTGVLTAIALSALAQVSAVKRGFKMLEKGEFEKVDALLDKTFEKDSAYPGAFYLKARLFYVPSYLEHNIDSSYRYVQLARTGFDSLSIKEQEGLSKALAGAIQMERLKEDLDSLAYNRAKERNSEESYIFYLANFRESRFEQDAIQWRNKKAFETALATNSYKAYLHFMKKYPEADQFAEAEARYEKLYFVASTGDGKMQSFQSFLKKNPTTPYREEAEAMIYRVMTAGNAAKDYLNFIDQYPKSFLAGRAKAFLYHILEEQDQFSAYPSQYLTDSLQVARRLAKPFLPFLEGGEFGFMDIEGNTLLEARFPKTSENYLCSVSENDFILINNQLIGLNGAEIATGVKNVSDLGNGVLKILGDQGYGLVHKSGVIILNAKYQDVTLLLGKFIAYQQNGQWGLKTISGISLVQPQFDTILAVDNFLLFEKDELWEVKIGEELIQAADNGTTRFQERFTDYELLENKTLWLQSNEGEVIYNDRLQEMIPLKKHEIFFLPYGYATKDERGYRVANDSFKYISEEVYDSLNFNSTFISIKADSGWTLAKSINYIPVAEKLNTVRLLGNNFAIGTKNDTTLLFLGNGASIALAMEEKVTLLASTNSMESVLVASKDKKEVIDKEGNRVNLARADRISPLGEYIVVTQNNKKGLYSINGKLLSSKYDAIGNYENSYVSLLKEKKFGFFSTKQEVSIPTAYDKRVEPYNSSVFIVQKDDLFGLVDKSGDKLSGFEFKEVAYWTDSVALVKLDKDWNFYNLNQKQIEEKPIRSFTYVENTGDEIMIIALGENGYGVISNQQGEIIPLSFDDILNIGRAGQPLFFTEKDISEADFFVVIYYNQKGEVIRKHAYEAADYERIYCDQ